MRSKNNKKDDIEILQKTALDYFKEQEQLNDYLLGKLNENQQEIKSLGKTRGAKNHKPTEATRLYVLQNAGFGVPQDLIANALRISDDTLRKYYKEELTIGKANVAYMITKSLAFKALSGDFKAQELYLKTQLKWSNSAEDTFSKQEENLKVLDSSLMQMLNIAQNAPAPVVEEEKEDLDEDDDLT